MKFLSKIFYGLFLALLLSVAGLFLATMLPIPGNVEVKIVKSGSMEPSIRTGGIVILQPSSHYGVGDVITFGEDSRDMIPTTHRIVSVREENGKTFFTTKGDANEEADTQIVVQSDIAGKVIVAVPYAGYILDFARQPLGFALLIGLPAAMIIFDEFAAIWTEMKKIRVLKRRTVNRGAERATRIAVPRMMDIRRPTRRKLTVVQEGTSGRNREAIASFVVAVPLIITLAFSHIGSTVSYVSDVETSTGNTFRAAAIFSNTANPFNVVLNEFLPRPDNGPNGLNLGNDSSDMPLGEWVELYNNGDVKIDLSGWYIADASGGLGNQQAVVGLTNTQPATTTIPAHGWLVVYFNKAVLNNTGDSIFLYTNTNVLIDSYSYDNPSDFCENEPTPTDTNASSTPSAGSCSGSQVAPNKSYARIPDGTGAWVDPIPTPGAPNMLEENVDAPVAYALEENATPTDIVEEEIESNGMVEILIPASEEEVSTSTPHTAPEENPPSDETSLESMVIMPIPTTPTSEEIEENKKEKLNNDVRVETQVGEISEPEVSDDTATETQDIAPE